MKRFNHIIVPAFIIIISGCGSDSSDSNSSRDLPSASSVPVLTLDSNGRVVSRSPGQVVPTSAPVNPAAPATSAAPSGALNPAHGQPGHRCDIAVGAPLNSQPAANPTSATQATPTTTTTVTPATTTAAKPANGLNPAHGQPGHRCDIAVGAPLNSKPVTTTTTTTTKPGTTPANPITVTPVNNNNAGASPTSSVTPMPLTPILPANNTSTGAAPANGLNPAHGQPGHRCDIAVGAPLNSKPATKQ